MRRAPTVVDTGVVGSGAFGAVDVVVIGAGQAGLSSAYHLRRLGFEPETDFVVLDAAQGAGGAWRERPPTLTMRTVHGIFHLPGTRWRASEAESSRPVAEVVADYYADYERRFELPIHRPVEVRSVRNDDGDGLVVDSDDGGWSTRAVINATGTWTQPYWPYYPGAGDFGGRQLHSSEYRGPEEFRGRHVMVVGGGHSAIHVLSEVADITASTTWVTRRPPAFYEGEFTEDYGRWVVAQVDERVRAGLPPQSVVSVTGLGYTPVVERALDAGALERLPMFSRIVPGGAVWDDGRFVEADVIIWATGFRAALGHLAPLGLRETGGGVRMDGTRVVADPRVHLVGYGPSASTVGASRAGRTAALEVKELLAGAGAKAAA